MLKKIITSAVIVVLIVVAAVTFVIYNNNNNDTTADKTVDPNGEILYGSSEPKTGLIPSNTNETGGGIPIDLIFAKLIAYDNLDGSIKNEVAESITPNEDLTVYDVKLKDSFKFTNGETVDADSFINAWNFAANASNAQKNASFFSLIKGASLINPDDENVDLDSLKGKTLEGLKKINDFEFQITLEESSVTFPLQLGYSAFSPLPKAAFTDENGVVTDVVNKNFGENPIGNGPYKFVEWKHDEQIVITKNDDYKGVRQPKNGSIKFVIYSGDSTDTQLADIASGNLDVMASTGGARYVAQKEDPNIQWNIQPSPTMDAVEVPVYLEHFGQNEEGKLRRQALSYALDRDSLRNSGDGTGKDMSTVCPAIKTISGCDLEVSNKDILSFNPEKAKELWAQADAISKFENPSLDLWYNADSGGKDQFELICNSWKNTLGISSVAQPTPDFKTLLRQRDEGTVKGAYRAGWLPDYPSIENYLAPLYMSNASSNTSQFADPEFDKLVENGQRAKTLDEANALFKKAAEYIVDQSIAIFESEGTRKAAYSLNVKFNPEEVSGWDGYPALYAFEKIKK